jgi:chromosome segregation ATPase
MTKTERKLDGPEPAEPGAGRGGPSPELVERFRQFEARVDEAVRLIAQLKQDRQRLEARLEEATQARAEAVRRIDALVDKIDGML